jgi:hypothetical protein
MKWTKKLRVSFLNFASLRLCVFAFSIKEPQAATKNTKRKGAKTQRYTKRLFQT